MITQVFIPNVELAILIATHTNGAYAENETQSVVVETK